MGLIRRAWAMPEHPPRVAWQFEIGHIVIIHRDDVPADTQGVVFGAWLNGSVGVMIPDLGISRTLPFTDLELVGVMPRFTSGQEDRDVL